MENVIWFMLLGLIPAIFSVNPGLKLRITQKGLNYAATQAIKSLNLQGQTIPDIHGTDDVKVGKVDYDITNARIQSFVTPHSGLSIQSGTGIHWSVQGASMTLTGDWHYHYKLGFISIKDSGSFEMNVRDAGINIVLVIGESGGKPTIHSQGCSASVGSVDVHFHGGASWLYNIFDDQISHAVKGQLTKILCTEANKAVNEDAEKALARTKLVVSIKKTGVLDYSMLSDPIFATGYVDSYHKGEIYMFGSHKEAPFHPEAFPEAFNTSSMAYIWVSDYLMNTAGYALQNQNILQYYLKPEDLKPQDRYYLNTTCPNKQCIGNFIVKLQDDFPNCVIYINMSTSIAPTLNIENGKMFGKFQGFMTYFARLPNNTMKYLFNTSVAANISITASVQGQNLTAQVTSITPNVTVTDTQIGEISGAALTWTFKTMSRSFIVPKFNEIGAEGLPLPGNEQISFVNPTLKLVDNAIMLGTDLVWHPHFDVDLKKKINGVDNTLYFKSKSSAENPTGKLINSVNKVKDLGKSTADLFKSHPFKKVFG